MMHTRYPELYFKSSVNCLHIILLCLVDFIPFIAFVFARKAVTEINHHYKVGAFAIGGELRACVRACICMYVCMYVCMLLLLMMFCMFSNRS